MYSVLYLRQYYSLPTLAPMTEFQEKVYLATMCIPTGYVTTYGNIAKLLNNCGDKADPRAVGQALKNNPLAPYVPCHRVVAANGIGGFFGHSSGNMIDNKISLLVSEGVVFDPKGNISESCILSVETLIGNIYAKR